MAQIILKGKRADRWIGLGRNRIRELRRQKGDWLSQRVELPDGTLTAQKLGRFDRIMIEVRDPYIIQDVRGDFVLPKPYKPLAGGITGEPFLISAFSDPAELLDVDGEPIPRVPASEAYVPLGKYLYATYAFNIVSSFTSLQGVMCIDTDTGASRLIYSNYGVSSPQGLSFNSFAPLMQTDDRDYLMAFSFAARPADDEVSQQGFIALTKSNANEALIPIWPLLGTNDGYYDGIDIAYGLTNAGRGKVMWIQGYRPSYDGDGNVIHDASRPEVIVYSHPGTYHRKLLRDLPGVPDIRFRPGCATWEKDASCWPSSSLRTPLHRFQASPPYRPAIFTCSSRTTMALPGHRRRRQASRTTKSSSAGYSTKKGCARSSPVAPCCRR
jgi:hypothetical protein